LEPSLRFGYAPHLLLARTRQNRVTPVFTDTLTRYKELNETGSLVHGARRTSSGSKHLTQRSKLELKSLASMSPATVVEMDDTCLSEFIADE
jgi:hypothetical protein